MSTAWNWPVEAIAIIKTELETKLGASVPHWVVGTAEGIKITGCPRIIWKHAEAGGSVIGPAKKAGGTNPPAVANVTDVWALQIWETTEANVWTTLQNIVACSTRNSLGGRVRFGRFNWALEERTKNSYSILVEVKFDLKLVDAVRPTVVVEGFVGDVIDWDTEEVFAQWPSAPDEP